MPEVESAAGRRDAAGPGRRRAGGNRRRPPPRHPGRRGQEHVRLPRPPRHRARPPDLDELHRIASEASCRATRLDTNDFLAGAVGLYRAAGYREVADYNGNAKADLWFEREL